MMKMFGEKIWLKFPPKSSKQNSQNKFQFLFLHDFSGKWSDLTICRISLPKNQINDFENPKKSDKIGTLESPDYLIGLAIITPKFK